MHTKTMEGLVGARTNANLMDTPMRVYDEAQRKGNTAAMERSIGYAGEMASKAEEYKTTADKGMKEEAKEAKEKAELEREEAIQKRREEREKQENRIDESKSADTCTDIVEISEEGKAAVKENLNVDSTSSDAPKVNAVEEPVTYTKTGDVVHLAAEIAQPELSAAISVSV